MSKHYMMIGNKRYSGGVFPEGYATIESSGGSDRVRLIDIHPLELRCSDHERDGIYRWAYTEFGIIALFLGETVYTPASLYKIGFSGIFWHAISETDTTPHRIREAILAFINR